MATLRTTAQSNRFHALLTARKFDTEDKVELVRLYTNGRETSSTRMSMDEMALAIAHLEGEQNTSMRKMRAKIINIYRDIIAYPDPHVLEQHHWDGLNTHLLRTCKKRLHELGYDELVVATTSLDNWRKSSTTKMVNDLLGVPARRVGRPKKDNVNPL